MTSLFTDNQRDFMLLNIYVLEQQGRHDKAAVLLEAMSIMGDQSPEVILGRAVLKFSRREWLGTLSCLEELDLVDPIERFGHYEVNETQRMRRYLKARCLFELEGPARAKEAVDVYLRHGAKQSREEVE